MAESQTGQTFDDYSIITLSDRTPNSSSTEQVDSSTEHVDSSSSDEQTFFLCEEPPNKDVLFTPPAQQDDTGIGLEESGFNTTNDVYEQSMEKSVDLSFVSCVSTVKLQGAIDTASASYISAPETQTPCYKTAPRKHSHMAADMGASGSLSPPDNDACKRLSFRSTSDTDKLSCTSTSERERLLPREEKGDGFDLGKGRKRLLLVTMALMDMFGAMMFSMMSPFFPIMEKGEEKEGDIQVGKWRKMVILYCMVLMNMFGTMMFGIMGPYFSIVAREKNSSALQSGVVFAAFEFTMIFMAPVMGNFIVRIGVRLTYSVGFMVAGLCSIVFGLLVWSPQPWFIILCAVVRMLQGTGYAAFITSTYAVLVRLFRDDMASIFGILETMKGVGYMIGPILGSGLYTVMGYIGPFVFIGALVMLMGCIVSFIMPSCKDVPKSDMSICSLFVIPQQVLCGFMHGTIAYMFTSVNSTMALHLDTQGVSQIYIGVAFFALAAGYVSGSPVIGKITDRYPVVAYPMLLVGFILLAICLLLLGPAPFLHIHGSLTLLMVVIFFTGVTAATTVVTFTIMFAVARLYNFTDSLDTYGKISGFVEAFHNAGAFVGPILGGVTYDRVGWEWAEAVVAFLVLFCVLMLCIMVVWQKLYKGIGITEGLAQTNNISYETIP